MAEASEIVRTECVGNGKLASPPDAFVKKATLHLCKTLKLIQIKSVAIVDPIKKQFVSYTTPNLTHK